jgi:hypothetical protein
MAFNCIYCGAGLPNDANYCFKCGKPLKGDSTTSKSDSSQIEYKQVYFDWSNKAEINFITGNSVEQQVESTAVQRIEDELRPYLDEGWALDGSFDSAVKLERKSSGSSSVLYTGATVKLCRDCEGC